MTPDPLTPAAETELRDRDADFQRATREARDPTLHPDERACAAKAAAEHTDAVLALLGLRP
jgi:hypothetical protein